jgi:hypothetical protein
VPIRSFTKLLLIFLACVAVSYVVSTLLLRHYRRAVVRSMSLAAPRDGAPPLLARSTTEPPLRPLAFASTYAEAMTGQLSPRWPLNAPDQAGTRPVDRVSDTAASGPYVRPIEAGGVGTCNVCHER